MRMVRPFINLELRQQLVAEAVLGNHSLYRVMNELFGLFFSYLGYGGVFLAAFPPRIAHIFLGGFLFAGDADFFGIDHHDEISRIQMGRKDGFVLAAQYVCDLHSQPPQHGTVGIDYMPLAFVQIHFRQMRFHFLPIKGRRHYQMGRTSQYLFKIYAGHADRGFSEVRLPLHLYYVNMPPSSVVLFDLQ